MNLRRSLRLPAILLATALQTLGSLQIQVLTTSAKEGHVPSQFNLAELYAEGVEITRDDEKAAFWYKKAAEQNLPQAQYALALCYSDGKGVTKDSNTALVWLSKAVDFYYPPALYEMGRSFEYGKLGLDKNPQKAVQWMREATAKEYAPALGALGTYYLNGFGVKTDLATAIDWFIRGAKLGDQQSIKIIADNCSDWLDYIEDTDVVMTCILPLAENGDLKSQLALGMYYQGLENEDQAPSKAVLWLTQAAEQGSVDAAKLLVEHHQAGKGTEKDPSVALDYCRMVAEQGDAEYQEKLASMYVAPGALQNLEESYVWYLKAAKQERLSAQIRCVFIHGQGLGIPKNRVEAYAWSMVVGNNGKKIYQKNLEPILSLDEKMQGMRRYRALLMEIRQERLEH